MGILERILAALGVRFFGGGGGSSKVPSFKAQGNPPGFDYQSAAALNQLGMGVDAQGYAVSDKDFANRYPGLQQANDQYQANLAQQTGQVAQGAAGQAGLMQGLAGTIAGRQATPTTGDIQAMQQMGGTAASAVQPMYNLGAQQAGLAAPIVGAGQQQMGLAGGLVGLGQQQAGLAGPLTQLGMQQAGLSQPLTQMGGQIGRMGQQQAGIGQGINQMGGQLAQAAQIPYQTGQQLLNEPIDPLTQQQMMRAGLSSAAGSMGAASLGQGMAGQAAAARQLGLNTLAYGQAMRQEGMGDINQYASMLGAAGQMRGLGASTIGAGGQTVGLGGQTIGLGGQQLAQGGSTIGLGGQQLAQGGGTIGLGGQQLAQGAQTVGLGGSQLAQAAGTYGAGANTAATAGGLYGAAQGAQEQYGMDTAQQAAIYGGLQNQQAQNLLGNMANAGQLFQKRPFGISGTSAAQSELGQANALNSFNQANYATQNGIAFNQQQVGAQQAQLNASNQAAQNSMMVGIGTAAVTTAATAAGCWVARACYPDNRWKVFRHWLINKAPAGLRRLYLRHGEFFAGAYVSRSVALRVVLRLFMDRVIERTPYVCFA